LTVSGVLNTSSASSGSWETSKCGIGFRFNCLYSCAGQKVDTMAYNKRQVRREFLLAETTLIKIPAWALSLEALSTFDFCDWFRTVLCIGYKVGIYDPITLL